jgi:hypothetical protein
MKYLLRKEHRKGATILPYGHTSESTPIQNQDGTPECDSDGTRCFPREILISPCMRIIKKCTLFHVAYWSGMEPEYFEDGQGFLVVSLGDDETNVKVQIIFQGSSIATH